MAPLGLQLVRDPRQFFFSFSAEGAATDFTELSGQRGLIVIAHYAITHAEQDVVLFVNVRGQQIDVALGGSQAAILCARFTAFTLVERRAHFLRMVAGEPVLVEHDADGAAVARDAATLKHRKQQLFLLGMVTRIGKEPHELPAPEESGVFESITATGTVDQTP
ncbi:MAG: hypothetical protein AAB341_03075 [Planctomycetota bacterium]